MSDTWIQLMTVIGSTLVIVLTFFGITVSLHNSVRNDINAAREESRAEIKAIAEEMKDFHNRLCSIEERRLREK